MSAVRTKNMMYVQQLSLLDPQISKLIIDHHGDQNFFNKHDGWYDCKPLLEYLAKEPRLKNDHIAVIVHDRDYKYTKDGQIARDSAGKPLIVEAHLHVARSTKKPSMITVLSNVMNDNKEEHVQAFNKKGRGRRKVTDESNMFSYLYHRTFKAQQLHKYQYSFTDGNANFDIQRMVEEASAEVAKVRQQEVAEQQRADDKDSLENYLNGILNGTVNLADRFSDPLLQRVYAKNKAPLDNAQLEYTETVVKIADLLKQAVLTNQDGKNDKRIAELKREFKERNGNMSQADNYFITGAAGSGKTVLAQLIASAYDSQEKPRGVYMATGKQHQFDGYESEFSIVLDDLRSQTYPPEMLLTVLDNNQTAKVLDARYKRKLTANLKCTVATTTVSFAEFVRYIPDKTDTGNAEDQYFRRFREVFVVGKPEKSAENEKNFIVKYKRYKVLHAENFGKAYKTGEKLKELETEKARGKDKFITLPIFRKKKGEGFEASAYSDYYLHFEKEGQITVPFAKLDKDIKPKRERSQMDKMLNEKTLQSMDTETQAITGIDFSDLSDKDRIEAYKFAKKTQENPGTPAKKIMKKMETERKKEKAETSKNKEVKHYDDVSFNIKINEYKTNEKDDEEKDNSYDPWTSDELPW